MSDDVDSTQITVPKEIAAEVQRFATFLIQDRSLTHHSSPAETATEDADFPLWDDSDLLRLAAARTATADHYRRIMDAVLENQKVGEWVSLDDLASWTQIRRSALGTFRTHLYRYIHSQLREGTRAPFTARLGTDLRPARGREMYYRVSSPCAEQWTRVRATLMSVP